MTNRDSEEMIEGFVADPAGERIAELERLLRERQEESDAQAMIVTGLQEKLNAAILERDEQKRRCEELEEMQRSARQEQRPNAAPDASVQLKLKDQQLQGLRRNLEEAQFQQRRLEAALKQSQQSQQASTASGGGGSKLLNDRLLEARARIADLEAETEPLQVHGKRLEEELKRAQEALGEEKKESKARESALREELAELEAKVAERPLRELRKQKNEAEEASSRLQAELAERDAKLRDAAREQRRLEDLLQDRVREHESLSQYLAQVEEKLERRKAKLKEAEMERDQAELAYQALQDQLEGRHVRSVDQVIGGSVSPRWLGLVGAVALVLGAVGGFATDRWIAPATHTAQASAISKPVAYPPVQPEETVIAMQPEVAETAAQIPAVQPDSPPAPPPASESEAPPQLTESPDAAVAEPSVQPPVAVEVARVSLRDPLRDGGEGPEMIGIPDRSFLMGDETDMLAPEETPQHEVSLGSFYMGRYEVSFAQYDRFARATGRGLPPDEGWGRGDRPVINVSWDDARAYAAWLSAQTGQRYRLPTEAEWEFAARAGVDTFYWWGYKPGTNNANCFNCGSQWDGALTAPVGSFRENPFGLHDTAGNVMEWVEDCYHDNYQGAPDDGSAWVEGDCSRRSVRGGAYNKPVERSRVTRRAGLAQGSRLSNLGFRLVREP